MKFRCQLIEEKIAEIRNSLRPLQAIADTLYNGLQVARDTYAVIERSWVETMMEPHTSKLLQLQEKVGAQKEFIRIESRKAKEATKEKFKARWSRPFCSESREVACVGVLRSPVQIDSSLSFLLLK